MDQTAAPRFALLDAMRGVAAIAVVVFHLRFNSAQARTFEQDLPSFVSVILSRGAQGVGVFFVISGFVITYSTRALAPDMRSAARFALRRQVRLDPPYFVTVFVIVAAAFAERAVGSLDSMSYGFTTILGNLVYLQGFLDLESIVAVSWTLCLEVQFYLVWIIVLLAAGAVAVRIRSTREHAVHSLALGAAGALGVASLTLSVLRIDSGPWFIGTWQQFFGGMIVCGWYLKWCTTRQMSGYLALWVASLLISGPRSLDGAWFALLATLFVLGAIATGRLAIGSSRVLQFLGRLSYSIYLVHLVVIDLVMSPMRKVLGDSLLAALFSVVVAVVVTIGASMALHRLVERPSLAWASRLRHGGRGAEVAHPTGISTSPTPAAD